MAGKANSSVYTGDDWIKTATYRIKSSQLPIDLTGATVSGKIQKGSFELPITCVITNAGQGKFKYSLSSTQTAALAIGVYKYEIQVTMPGPVVKTLITGNLNVVDDVA